MLGVPDDPHSIFTHLQGAVEVCGFSGVLEAKGLLLELELLAQPLVKLLQGLSIPSAQEVVDVFDDYQMMQRSHSHIGMSMALITRLLLMNSFLSFNHLITCFDI